MTELEEHLLELLDLPLNVIVRDDLITSCERMIEMKLELDAFNATRPPA